MKSCLDCKNCQIDELYGDVRCAVKKRCIYHFEYEAEACEDYEEERAL